MPQQSAPSSTSQVRRRRSGSWISRKIRLYRDSRQAQKKLQQLVILVFAVLIAFILGFYFFGPSFSAGE
jgi:hypothetical protein